MTSKAGVWSSKRGRFESLPGHHCRRSMDFSNVIVVCPMIKLPCANELVGDAGFPHGDSRYQHASGVAVNPGMPRAFLNHRAAAMEDCIRDINGT